MARTRVKICGITRLEDAVLAARCGVDALGFIFYEKSPRNILPAKATAIIADLPPFVDRVGVFVNTAIEQIARCAAAGLSCIQLHGDESPDFCTEVRERLPHCRIIKAFRVSEDTVAEEFSVYENCVDAFLLDTYVKGAKGGTGDVFDWSIIKKLKLELPVVLAGGLTPGNVVQAISDVQPYCLDVNSGIEQAPGIKDHGHIMKLMDLVASQ